MSGWAPGGHSVELGSVIREMVLLLGSRGANRRAVVNKREDSNFQTLVKWCFLDMITMVSSTCYSWITFKICFRRRLVDWIRRMLWMGNVSIGIWETWVMSITSKLYRGAGMQKSTFWCLIASRRMGLVSCGNIWVVSYLAACGMLRAMEKLYSKVAMAPKG